MKSKIKKQKRALVFWKILMLISVIGWAFCLWFNHTFGVSLEGIIFTISSPLKGADMGFLKNILIACFFGIIIFVFLDIFFKIVEKRFSKRFKILFVNWTNVLMVFSILAFISVLVYAEKSFDIIEYVKRKTEATQIYENYYIAPEDVKITADGETKNLIYIYLESMETTYASREDGGGQKENYIPNLTYMANNNISFSDKNNLGGFHYTSGTGWTMGALMATTAGVPFSFPVNGNGMDAYESFAPGIKTLGDILQEKGYYQEFICGSESEFAGRRAYFEEHGAYEIFDYNTAIEKGYIADDYKVWWGFEDEILYEIAKDELLRIAENEQPFNLTMLTVDTHHVDGYVCNLCQDTYSEQCANVVKCADNQIFNFVNWCKEQEFYEDTVIVIVGDHPRMDTSLVAETEAYDRTVYNCFINSSTNVEGEKINRVFTPMDMFPTTLSAMGYTIEGDSLALGTNLFSKKQTLAEKIGFDNLNEELGRYSEYYIREFSQR